MDIRKKKIKLLSKMPAVKKMAAKKVKMAMPKMPSIKEMKEMEMKEHTRGY